MWCISCDSDVLDNRQMAAILRCPCPCEASLLAPQRQRRVWLLSLFAASLEGYIELFSVVVDHSQGPVAAQILLRQLDEIVVPIVPEASARLRHLLRLAGRLKEELALEVIEFAI